LLSNGLATLRGLMSSIAGLGYSTVKSPSCPWPSYHAGTPVGGLVAAPGDGRAATGWLIVGGLDTGPSLQNRPNSNTNYHTYR
jgi:hypothetical protein